jgi:5'-nucleotidase (lipoprotein e(P4) family)
VALPWSHGHSEEAVEKDIVYGNERLGAVLWMQTALEYEFMCRQSFRLASSMLREALRDSGWTAALEQRTGFERLPPAIIIDVDETVLDNSPFDARLIMEDTEYDEHMWSAWVREASAGILPGAGEFLQFAASEGVAVFFVTNRNGDVERWTVENLSNVLDLTVEPDQVLSRNERPGWSSDKTSRRRYLAQDHRILLLIGDDFNDFVHLGGVSVAERVREGRRYGDCWGKEWIILPNPAYGSWERALYGCDESLTRTEKLRMKQQSLRTGR